MPFDNRVWYKYPGHDSEFVAGNYQLRRPEAIARVMADGTEQLYKFSYETYLGRATEMTDPMGRRTRYVWRSDGEGLEKIQQCNSSTCGPTTGWDTVLHISDYDTDHRLPLEIIDAAGETTTFEYYDETTWQIKKITDPGGNTVEFTYDNDHYLSEVEWNGDPGGPSTPTRTTFFTVGDYGLVGSMTDTDGDTYTYDYDELNRLRKITYPDDPETTREWTYNRLDLTVVKDRLDRLTTMTYDGLGRLLTLEDPEERTLTFDWCACGGLSTLTDDENHTTTWQYDIQNRITHKIFEDTTDVEYYYEENEGIVYPPYYWTGATSRLARIVDAEGQTTHFSYNLDDSLAEKTYEDENVSTPDVSFSYDPYYPRVTMMSDGTGDTTYSYHAAGDPGALKVAMVDPPHDVDVQHFIYDELGRLDWRLLNGTPVEILEYDGLGRVLSRGTPGTGPFTYEYDGASGRLENINYPNGQVTSFTYYPASLSRMLDTLRNYLPESGELRGGEYTFFADGSLESELDLPAETEQRFATYDEAGQLKSFGDDPTRFDYDYSDSGCITGQTLPGSGTTAFVINDVNQIEEEDPPVGGNLEYEWDLNGNLVSRETAAGTVTYEWDAENRLVAVNAGTHRSEFIYDGIGQRTRILEIEDSSTVSDRGYLWCGGRVCGEFEYQDAGGEPYWLYFRRGLFRIGNSPDQRYLTLDRMGSVLDMTNKIAAGKTSYAYDPFGNATKLEGEEDSPLTYAGYLAHRPTGLNLTWFRAYDPTIGRWLSRDPLGEFANGSSMGLAAGQINLYSYVLNSPPNSTDPTGQAIGCLGWVIVIGAAVGVTYWILHKYFPRDPPINDDCVSMRNIVAATMCGSAADGASGCNTRGVACLHECNAAPASFTIEIMRACMVDGKGIRDDTPDVPH